MIEPQYIFLGEQLISEFLNKIKDYLLNYLSTEDRNASGKSAQSLQVVEVSNCGGKLTGHSGIEYVFRGRGPGKMPPLNVIIDWCNSRGIPRRFAWIIARNIAESGTKLYQQKRNLLNEFITEDELIKFKDNLAKLFVANLTSEIQSLTVQGPSTRYR